MARGAIQFQKGLSLSVLQRLYGSEENCSGCNGGGVLARRVPLSRLKCNGHEHGPVYGRRFKRYQLIFIRSGFPGLQNEV